MASKMRQIGSYRLQKTETFHGSTSVGESKTTWSKNSTWRELLTTDYNKLITNVQDRINSDTNNSSRTSYEELKSFYLQAQAKKEELLKTQPNLASILVEEEKIKKLVNLNEKAANQIAL